MSEETKGAILSAVDAHVDDEVATAVAPLNARHEEDVAHLSELERVVAARDAEIRRLNDIISGGNGDGGSSQPPLLLGRSASNYDHGPLNRADVDRIYQFGAVDGEVSKARPKAILLTDDGTSFSTANLESKFSGLTTKYPDILWVWLVENEVTAHDHTATQAKAYVDKTRAHRAATDKFDNVITACNLTTYGVKTGRHLPLFDAGLADVIEAITSSCYNPGRNSTPPKWDTFDYLDVVLDLLVEHDIDDFWVGEFGNPVDPNNPAKRPDYDGDFLEAIEAKLKQRGKKFRGASYWDSWKDESPTNPDNRLQNDSGRTAQAMIDRVAAINAARSAA